MPLMSERQSGFFIEHVYVFTDMSSYPYSIPGDALFTVVKYTRTLTASMISSRYSLLLPVQFIIVGIS